MHNEGIPRQLLQSLSKAWNIELSSLQLEQFEQYAVELIAWNKRTNLTTITDPRAIVIRHFLDSLALIKVYPEVAPESLADIGTGAGFPGVPLKLLWPDMRLLLVESIRRKTEFLQHIVDVLGLVDVEICTARAEELGHDNQYREQYALVTARAVASLNVLAEYCLPLCKLGGYFVAPKSGTGLQEAQAAVHAFELLGGQLQDTLTVQLPEVEKRTLVVVAKTMPTPNHYPRRVGVPFKRPL